MLKFFRSKHPAIKLTTLLAFSLLTAGAANAFSELNKAQALIYDTPHLKNTDANQTLTYLFKAEELEHDIVQDTVELAVQKAHEDGSRDVVIDFLKDERHIAFPDFTAFKGNPVIIAMLEHIAQKMGKGTGGGALYFRNRIRDALAGDVSISNKKIALAGTEVNTTILTFKPFSEDQYIRGFPEYVNSTFAISLSESVSGGLVGIEVVSADDKKTYFSEYLTLKQ